MTIDNSFYRVAREGEEPTHVSWCDKIISYDDYMSELCRSLDVVFLVKLGWFSSDEKPKEDGNYLCRIESTLEYCKPFFHTILKFTDGEWKTNTMGLSAWSEIPPFEQPKEDFKDWLKKNHPDVIDNFDIERAIKFMMEWDKSTSSNAGKDEAGYQAHKEGR